jgi:hypothetical protein
MPLIAKSFCASSGTDYWLLPKLVLYCIFRHIYQPNKIYFLSPIMSLFRNTSLPKFNFTANL